MRKAIAWVTCVAVLAAVNFAIRDKELLLATGQVVYLELAPLDPRSLMQGDYMALRFKIANDARPAATAAAAGPRAGMSANTDVSDVTADGRIVATLDANSVASFSRLDAGQPTAANEVLLRYRVRGGTMKFATNAFFFEEGSAKRYEGARYGEFRVAPNGNLLLTGLRGKDLQPL